MKSKEKMRDSKQVHHALVAFPRLGVCLEVSAYYKSQTFPLATHQEAVCPKETRLIWLLVLDQRELTEVWDYGSGSTIQDLKALQWGWKGTILLVTLKRSQRHFSAVDGISFS